MEAVLEHPWICLLCDSSTKYTTQSLVKFRPDWIKYQAELFPNMPQENIQPPQYKEPELRVFSAFDGICCGIEFIKSLVYILTISNNYNCKF